MRWVLQEAKDGSVTVLQGRKEHSTHPSESAARRAISREVAEGDTVHHEAPDGYRTNITRTLRGRRGWRR
jgi:hypothetical protein